MTLTLRVDATGPTPSSPTPGPPGGFGGPVRHHQSCRKPQSGRENGQAHALRRLQHGRKGRPGPSPAESVVLFPYSRSVLGGSPPGPGALVLQSCCVSSSSPTVSRASSNSLAPLPATTAAPLLPLTRWPGGLLPQCDQCHQDVRRKHGFLAIELFFLSILQIGCCKTGSASFSRPHS